MHGHCNNYWTSECGQILAFNRLLGKRSAIVDDFPGVTRDRLYGEVTHEERNFYIVDTGGIMAGVDGPSLICEKTSGFGNE